MSVEQMTVVDFQWNNETPNDSKAYNEIRELWSDQELPNDVAYVKWDEFMAERYPAIKAYLDTLPQDNPFLLHWWW